jgi:hypothetical protein
LTCELSIEAGVKQIPNTREVKAALSLGDESVMTDAMEAVGQDIPRLG